VRDACAPPAADRSGPTPRRNAPPSVPLPPEAGLKTWLDEEKIRPGQVWQTELEHQIEKVTAVCVFVGEGGAGPWQNVEIRAFLSQFVSRGCVVIPVLLPTAPAIPPLPIFLREMMWADLRQDYSQQLARLIGAFNHARGQKRQ
jgi:hypothetical protein